MKIMQALQDSVNELKVLAYSAFVFLNIDTDIVTILMVLMGVDTVFGIWKSVVLGVRFSVKRLFFGVITKLMILLIPMTLALMGKGLKYDFTPMVDVVLRILVVAEGISIFASFYSIRTKKTVENVDIITMVLVSLRKGFLKLVSAMLYKIENPEELLGEKPAEPIKNEENADI